MGKSRGVVARNGHKLVKLPGEDAQQLTGEQKYELRKKKKFDKEQSQGPKQKK